MPHKILVVDDEPDWESVIRQRFKKQIQQKEWEFIFARDGEEALEQTRKTPGITVVLLDINMPKKDGLTLLKELDKVNNPTIKTVMVTAYGDMENIRSAMNGGAFDFLTKPIDFKDLEITIYKALTQIDLIKDALAARDKYTALRRELEIAGRIQKSMLPRSFPPYPHRKEFGIYARMVPAKEVGGDFYDFFFIEEDRLAFTVGDVCGKGIPAALYMAKCCTLLRTTAMRIGHPGECLRRVNNLLLAEKESDSNIYLTIFFGVLNTKTGEVRYSCGGHRSPYLARANGTVAQMPQVIEYPVAIFENSEYEVEKIKLQKGDTLVCYTDGINEAKNSKGHQFDGDDKSLHQYLERTNKMPLEEMADGLITEIDAFVGDKPQADDMTLLALRYNQGH